MIQNIFGFAPYWSTSRLGQFVNDSSRLPFDAHLMAALVAPVCFLTLLEGSRLVLIHVCHKRALIWDEGTPQIRSSVLHWDSEMYRKASSTIGFEP